MMTRARSATPRPRRPPRRRALDPLRHRGPLPERHRPRRWWRSAASSSRRGGTAHILFLSPDNIANIVRAVSETGIIAVGMTFVIITAGIDLSVGALLEPVERVDRDA